ncbi:unnamed protein product, partial [Urochloa humidicola]
SKLIKSSSAFASPFPSLDLPRNTRALPFLAPRRNEARHWPPRDSSSLAPVLLFSRGPPRSRDPPRHSPDFFACCLQLMASPSAPTDSQEAARQSLIAISQSVPETPSPQTEKTPSSTAENGKLDDGADKYRSKLMSITDLSSDAQPTPCPPKDVTA